MFTVKKKSKKRKIKESPPKSLPLPVNETPTLPKYDIKAENEVQSEILELQDDERNDEEDPEAGQEPAGPEQSLPVSSEMASPPSERKVTSYINVSFFK